MRNRPSFPLRLLLALASASPLAGQGVLVVDDDGGPGVDFTELQDAVLAANEGDTILVRSGTYAPVTIEAKSLNVLADSGAFVDLLEPLGSTAPLLRIRGLAAG